MEDYVKCLSCLTEKVKPDVFLDLPLAVRQFGAKESFKSIVFFYIKLAFYFNILRKKRFVLLLSLKFWMNKINICVNGVIRNKLLKRD